MTRVLESDQLNYVNDEEAAYFGTATRRVSRYSESWIKSFFETTSASDRTERFPLDMNH